MKQKKSTSSKTITIDNSLLGELAQNKKVKYHHINLLAYLKDRATIEEGGLRFIKEITLLDINKYIDGDVKCRTAKKLLNDLVSFNLVSIDPELKLTPKKSFPLTLEGKVTKETIKGNFTILPEALIHSYPIGISTYLAIRSYHSKQAKMSIAQIQKRSKVSNKQIQLEILGTLEGLKFISKGVGGFNQANTYMCKDYTKIEFERTYNKFTGRPKKVLQELQEEPKEIVEPLVARQATEKETIEQQIEEIKAKIKHLQSTGNHTDIWECHELLRRLQVLENNVKQA